MPIFDISSRVTRSAVLKSKRRNGPQPACGSEPRKKFRETLINGIMRQVLVDRGNPGRERIAGRGEMNRLPSTRYSPSLGLMHAGEDLDQGRFAGAVVAQQAHHLAGVDRHRDVLEGDHRAEIARDVAHLEIGVSAGTAAAGVALMPFSRRALADEAVDQHGREQHRAQEDLEPVRRRTRRRRCPG